MPKKLVLILNSSTQQSPLTTYSLTIYPTLIPQMIHLEMLVQGPSLTTQKRII